MKNKLRFFLVSALTFVLACLTAAPAAAADYDFTVDGVYYKVVSMSELTCEVVSGDSKYTGDVTIPEKVVYGVRTFSVTEIVEKAFFECTGLTSVTIPNSVTEIGRWAFYGCTSLTSVAIPNSVTKISERAFSRCSGLTSVTIPNSVTEIGYAAFHGCSVLTSVTIPNSVTSLDLSGCSGLTSVTIPNSVTSLDLSGCSGLTSVTIPNSVTSISGYCFKGCTALTNLTIEDGSSTLRLDRREEKEKKNGEEYHYFYGAFYSCPLESVYVGRNLSYEISTGWIYSACYSPFEKEKGENKITKLTIGSTVTEVGEKAFSGCSALKNVISLAATPPNVAENNFSTANYLNATLYVPVGTSSAYASAEGWRDFFIMEGIPNAIKDKTLDQNGETTIFDLQGHRLAQPKKGINIINGKKVLVK